MIERTDSFRTRVPLRHDRFFGGDEGRPAPSLSFRTHLPARPSRRALRGDPLPHTREIARWIRDREPRASHAAFSYRGHVAERPEEGRDVAVRLWEVPSGVPLDADLPRDWFSEAPYKGMPFRLVTCLVEDDAGAPAPRGFIEPLGEETRR